ncbi:rhomboid family protein [Cytobacillus purgationiresistens]|uniref:Rhomboid protease GluP n=1 Tax=Cytobacillus purgationiresistens TaxID=863449 RepID=A0ABU0ADW3_9BACI|nr:rhomboid family intramembrane serine protease [Cytobacillus purgationiresistens]MDQ0269441.1 rhomboid protease GluP [Cytobacillus purgationiresistens]
MSIKEEYLFWELAHEFIINQDYRVIQLSESQDELWLEKMENKEARMIRLLCRDIDWSNWIQRDIENIAANGERIRKQTAGRDMKMLNIYVSGYPPVDDYTDKVYQPYQHPKNDKTTVKTILMDRAKSNQGLEEINMLFHNQINIQLHNKDAYYESDVASLKNHALKSASDKAKEEQALFDHGKPLFTYLFIVIQIAAFLWLEWKGGSTNTAILIEYGAKFNPLILDGEWWRFFTPIFLHIGFLHLLMNTLALFYLGTAVEKIFGKVRFLFIYLLAGFGGTLASFIFSPSVSAGASGAIFGCFGALLFFGLIFPKLFFRTIGFNILVVLGINLVFGFTVPGIDNAGHIGGLIGGFLATGIVFFPNKKRLPVQLLFFAGTLCLIAGGLIYGFSGPERQMNEQTAVMMAQEYVQSEQYDKTIAILSDYADNEEGTPETYFLLSFAEIKKGKMEEAKEHLHLVIEKNDTFHEAHYNLALLYLDDYNLLEAKKHASRAAEIDPDRKEYQELLDQVNSLE